MNFWVEPELFPSTLGSANQKWRALVIGSAPLPLRLQQCTSAVMSVQKHPDIWGASQ